MPQLKLHVKKVGSKNPQTKQSGFVVRVQNNGTATFDDIVKEAGHNTTMHKAELKMAFELCLDSVAEMLKQGFIVDLGPIGKLYPSCSSGWYEDEKDIKLSDVKPSLYYRAGEEVETAVRSAKLVWVKASDEDEEEGGASPDPSQGGENGGDEGGGQNSGGGTGTVTPDPGTGGGGGGNSETGGQD